MNDFEKDVELYKKYDPSGLKPVDDICRDLGWTRQKSYSIKYFISELTREELEILDKSSATISYVIIDAICIQRKEYKLRLLQNIDRINASDSPFSEIENLISQWDGIDPLSTLANRYWTEVGDYLTARHVDQPPFSKNAIGFIKSVGFKGYDNLSRPQRDWLLGLLKNDKERGVGDRFFVNEHLVQKGYKTECETIEKYEK